MQRYVPAERILLGTTRHNCVTRAPGVVYHSGAGETQIGSPTGDFAMAEATAAVLSSDASAVVACPDVKRLLWAKLMLNMTVNPMTALRFHPSGFVGENPHAQSIIRMLVAEAVAVAAADGVTFDAEAVISSIMQSARALATGRASMCQDIRAGRRTEIDFINGSVVRLGRQYGIPTPCHELMVDLIHAREDRNDTEKSRMSFPGTGQAPMRQGAITPAPAVCPVFSCAVRACGTGLYGSKHTAGRKRRENDVPPNRSAVPCSIEKTHNNY